MKKKKDKPTETKEQIAPFATSAARLEALLKIKEVIDSGWSGVGPDGRIVDRREHPNAIPIPANPLLGTPTPKLPKSVGG